MRNRRSNVEENECGTVPRENRAHAARISPGCQHGQWMRSRSLMHQVDAVAEVDKLLETGYQERLLNQQVLVVGDDSLIINGSALALWQRSIL